MNKLIAIFLLFFISVESICQPENEAINPEIRRCVFEPNAKILIKKYAEGFDHDIAKGDNVVFSYFYKAKDYVHVSDDEYSEYFRFEIHKPKRKFTLKDKDLEAANFIYNRGCFCPETGNYFIRKGTITAKRISQNKYNMHIKFTVEPRDTSGMMMKVEREVKAYFKKGKINID